MFPVGKSEAERKFWNMDEMIEELLLHLDPRSTLRLAQTHRRTQDRLQVSRVWKDLIKRSSPLHLHYWELSISHLVATLKLMKDTKANMLDLLDAICKANPSDLDENDSVQMSSPCHPDSFSISRSCFILLEQVEAAFGTTEHTIEAISLGSIFFEGSLLSALASRLSRQKQNPTSVHIEGIVMSNDPREAQGIKILMQLCPPWTINLSYLHVDDLGTERWGLLAEGLESHPGLLEAIEIQKASMEDASMEDLRVLWDALRPNGLLEVQGVWAVGAWDEVYYTELLEREDGQAGWIRLCQIKDLSEEAWFAQIKEAEGGNEEEGAEEEEEDEVEEESDEEGTEEQMVEGDGYEGDEEDV